MELKDYSIEELRAEIKRRNTLKKELQKSEPRCRNCVHLTVHPKFPTMYPCGARTWGKTYPRNYSVKRSTKACELFENKNE